MFFILTIVSHLNRKTQSNYLNFYGIAKQKCFKIFVTLYSLYTVALALLFITDCIDKQTIAVHLDCLDCNCSFSGLVWSICYACKIQLTGAWSEGFFSLRVVLDSISTAVILSIARGEAKK